MIGGGKDGTTNVVDGFCGIGGNAIQFSKICGFCVASELDSKNIKYTAHNANVYDLKENE